MASIPFPASAEEAADARAQRPTVAALLGDEVDAFLFDCDGTLYHAGQIIPGVAEAILHLRSVGKKVFFVTNTSSRSKEQLQAKLAKLGVPCEVDECVPSGVFTATYIQRTHPSAKRVYVVGGQGLVDELARVGIDSFGGPAEDGHRFDDEKFGALAETVAAERCDGVVVGWDLALNYHKIATASLVFQRHPDAFFYATNDDPADRVAGWLLPGNGPLLKGLEAACAACAPGRCGKRAPFGSEATVLGKPNPDYAKLIAEWNGIDLSRAVMVGDRLNTDILMGKQAGMRTLHVLTGVDGFEQIAAQGISPNFVLPSFGSLWTRRPGAPEDPAAAL